MHSFAVIGLGFGDEGKGKTVNSLCHDFPDALVVRYSGGPQAGHTVVEGDKRHVFSNFGSGTLLGNPTYWSQFCTVDPVGIKNETEALKKLGVTPRLYVNAKCPVITPADKYLNQMLNKDNGTCGIGVGTTIQREQDYYSLLVEDLFHPSILKIKLDLINKHYRYNNEETMERFLECVRSFTKSSKTMIVDELPKNYDLIFEGSQGLLLDQHYGFFPHVTRSNVGTTNILAIKKKKPTIYAVTRAYQTRHGNGPMTNTDIPHNIQSNPLETNIENEFQGSFRRSLLDVDLLKYAIDKDPILKDYRNNLVITCLDHISSDYRFTSNGVIIKCDSKEDFVRKLNARLCFDNVYISESDLTPSLRYYM